MTISEINLHDSNQIIVDKSGRSWGYFCQKRPIKITNKLLNEMKSISNNNGNMNLRICLHKNSESKFHDMVILERSGTYTPPHKHFDKEDSLLIIEGKLGIVTYNDDGTVYDYCLLEPNRTLMYKVGIQMYHAVIAMTDTVIYHESKPGPFIYETDSIYPPWGPNIDDPSSMQKYKDTIIELFK